MGYSCIFLKKKKKKGFDFNDSKWIFEIYFQRDLLRKIFSFKMKKKLIWKQQNIRTKIPRKQNHKVKFFTTKQTKVVRGQFSIFSKCLRKIKLSKGSSKWQINDF